jgi:hypothetical protein
MSQVPSEVRCISRAGESIGRTYVSHEAAQAGALGLSRRVLSPLGRQADLHAFRSEEGFQSRDELFGWCSAVLVPRGQKIQGVEQLFRERGRVFARVQGQLG